MGGNKSSKSMRRINNKNGMENQAVIKMKNTRNKEGKTLSE